MAKATTSKTRTTRTSTKTGTTRSRSSTSTRGSKSAEAKSTSPKTTPRKTPAAKPTASEPATPKATPATAATRGRGDAAVASAVSAAPSPTVVTEVKPVVQGREMKKKELIDMVVSRSGIKKKDAKPVVEAMMAVLGDALAEGRMLNLQPLGKIKVNRTKEMSGSRVLRCQIRQNHGGPKGGDNDDDKAVNDPLADAAE